MENLSDFYKQDTLGWYKYATSKYEVNRWLKKVGKEGLEELINSITISSDFNSAYKLAEEQYQEFP
ncbi:hypothetical protein [Pontibacter rugosus]|uniref:Uncharacterized protein n=1 Tax=Pontibacter rugosus TaxID=1745966 RepID=A0ABW3SMK0_9BACT